MRNPRDSLVLIYYDAMGNILFFGQVKQRIGTWHTCGEPSSLASPYSAKELGGELIRILHQGLTLTENDIDTSIPMHEKATGIKRWKEFTSGREMVSARYCSGKTIVLEKHKLYPDSSYRPIQGEGANIQIDASVSAGEIGDALLALM